MNFIWQHVLHIIDTYPGNPPLAAFLKDYFRQHIRLGARDRRAVSEAVFAYYRNALFFTAASAPAAVIFQCLERAGRTHLFLKQAFLKDPDLSGLAAGVQDPAIARSRFPEDFSPGIAVEAWMASMRQQPDVFIRIRGNKRKVLSGLEAAGIPFRVAGTNLPGDPDAAFYEDKGYCLALPNGSKIDSLLAPESYVVQDWASQASMAIAGKIWNERRCDKAAHVWDVCSGAGGKALFWKDRRPGDFLWASDIRKSILHNLKSRFHLYGIGSFRTCVLDAADENDIRKQLDGQTFDAVICDVPCSGSGTWSRTPERLYFFDKKELPAFTALQYTIAAHAAKLLKRDGLLFYITCSVFREENEQVTGRLCRESSLQLVYQQLINGMSMRADSMFIAVFRYAE